MLNLDIEKIIKELTLQEKAQLLCGHKSWKTYEIKRLNIPPLIVSDGPHGVRKELGGTALEGASNTATATCFPTGVTSASSWNKDILYSIGKDIANECKHYGIDVVLGPAINIKRNPRCGRNFEYFSEDPYLSGKLATSFVRGVQDQNVGTSIKHFACNNSEHRFNGDSIVDERALREIYLKPFEMVVKSCSPYTIMNSYNKINGIHASENEFIMKKILKEEWNYDGFVMTDWGGLVNRDKALLSGTDLEMPGMIPHNVNSIIHGVKSGLIPIEIINDSVRRILKIVNKTKNGIVECDFEKHYKSSIKYAEESAVLLKNNGVLPLNKEEKFLVIGDLFVNPRYQGSGSSLLNPYKMKTHKEVFDEEKVNYEFAQGYKASELTENTLLEEIALEKAKKHNKILLFIGQTDYVESEGYDRETMCLPNNQISLINKLLELNKEIVVILFGGSPVEMPFTDSISSLLNMYLPGVGGASACFNILFGLVSPSGKLAETWPISYKDVPFGDKFISSPLELYKESIYVGYRYYLSSSKEVLYPFGFGLSYTEFEYSSIRVYKKEKEIEVCFNIKNVGNFKGKEVYQIYISKKDSTIFRPKRELKQFGKIELDINEIKEVSLKIPFEDLEVFDDKNKRFVLEGGEYLIEVGKSASDIVLSREIIISGEKLDNIYSFKIMDTYSDFDKLLSVDDKTFEELIGYKLPTYIKGKRPYTLETPISEYETFFGKFIFKLICGVGLSEYKKALKMEDGPEKERKKKAGLFVYQNMKNNTLRALCFGSSGMLKYKYALVLLDLANNKVFKAIGKLFKKDSKL